jgi:hypothetical protein
MSGGKRVVEGEMRWSSKLYSSRGCCEANMVGEVVVCVSGGEGVLGVMEEKKSMLCDAVGWDGGIGRLQLSSLLFILASFHFISFTSSHPALERCLSRGRFVASTSAMTECATSSKYRKRISTTMLPLCHNPVTPIKGKGNKGVLI